MEFFFIILAIIGGLVGIFNDKKFKKTKEPKGTIYNSSGSATETAGEIVTNDEDGQQGQSNSGGSIERQRLDQRQRSAERMDTETQKEMRKRKHDSIIGGTNKVPENNLSAKQKQFKKRIKRNVNREGLVNGIIMAEILGSPRATKPYRSVISQRKE